MGVAEAHRQESASGLAEKGKLARERVKRSSHGEWAPASDRPDPVEVLERQAESRVPELVPLRYGRMLESPFAFYRGGAAVMAADLAETPASGYRVQLCGDAHLSNFGGFGAPDRRLVFDINDFDETLPGPWEWDVKRLAASIAIAGRDLGFQRRDRRRTVVAAMRRYREAMRDFAKLSNLAVWYSRFDVESVLAQWQEGVTRKRQRKVQRGIAKAQSKDSMRALRRLTHRVNGDLRIVSDPPLIVPIEELEPAAEDAAAAAEAIGSLLRAYRQTLQGSGRHLIGSYRYAHLARKVVGVGSVGTRAWVVLLLGRDDGDPLFLQVKEAEASVLEPYAGKSRFANHGRRVVEGQWLMQSASDLALGWIHVTGLDGVERDFYVRQLWDWKASIDVEGMTPGDLATYGEICGWTLARAHARSGDRVGIAAYLGSGDKFDRAIAEFSEMYADQNELDYARLKEEVETGRLAAQKEQ
jgi:uncharacterized protein (DUF2252 family)